MNKLIQSVQANKRFVNYRFIYPTNTSTISFNSFRLKISKNFSNKQLQGNHIYSYQKFSYKRRNFKKEQSTNDFENNSNFIDLEENSFNSNQNNQKLTIHIKQFKNDIITILDQDNVNKFFFNISLVCYIACLALLLNEIRKGYNNSNQKQWKRYLKILLSLAGIFLILFKFSYKYELSKIMIKNISLQSDGKNINIKYYLPTSEIVNISDFKKVSKQEIFNIDPDIINIAIAEESYLVAVKENLYLIPASSIIYEKEILYQISSSQYINIIK